MLLRQLPQATATTEVIYLDGSSDELLLFLTQAGLEAGTTVA
jgi:hypothetical protein